jgi:hypothetical protein
MTSHQFLLTFSALHCAPPNPSTVIELQPVTSTIVMGEAVANHLRVTLEIGSKGKKVVAVAPDWPGLARGATTEQATIERLLSYVPRYAPVAKLAGMEAAFATITGVDVVERYPGTGSTDFWGISFAFSSIDQHVMSGEALERELTLMRARSEPHCPSYACHGAGLGEEARRAHA